MRLNFLELKNYRKFEHIRLELSDGIIGIIGNNGVGKSTLVESIGWALFGNQKEIVRINKESIRRINASVNDPTVVRLEFNFAGDEYILTREMTGKALTMDAKLIVNQKLIATGANEVTKYIEKKFGMDYKSFFISVFARQKELNALSSLTEGERRKTIVRMLGIDRLDEITEEISRKEKLSRERTADLSQFLIDDDGRSKEESLSKKRENFGMEKDNISKRIVELRQNQNKLKDQELSLKNQYTEISDTLKKLREKENQLNIIKAALQSKNKEESKLSNNLEEALEARKEVKNLVQLGQRLKKLKVRQDKLLQMKIENDRILRMKEEINSFEKEIIQSDEEITRLTKIKDGLKDLESDIINNKEIKDEAETELIRLNGEQIKYQEFLINIKKAIEENQIHLKQIEELGPDSKCPTCNRPLGDHYELLRDNLTITISNNKQELNKIEEAFENNQYSIKDLSNKLEALKKKQANLSEKEKQLIQTEKTLDMIIKAKEKLIEKQNKLLEDMKAISISDFNPEELIEIDLSIDELNNQREKLLGLKTIADKASNFEMELKALQSDIKELKEEIIRNEIDRSEIAFLENNIREIEKKKLEIRKQGEELYEFLLEFSKTQEKIIVRIEEIDKEMDSIVIVGNKFSEMQENLSYITKLSGLIKEFKKDLISRIIPALSQIATDLLVQLTDSKYTSLTLDDGYNISLEDFGEQHRLERFSGGESDLANLCLRLAISKIIAERSGSESINLLVLDEIFGSQDELRKRNLLMAFNGLAKHFRQIFLITHIEDIKDSVSNVLEVYEDERGISHIRVES